MDDSPIPERCFEKYIIELKVPNKIVILFLFGAFLIRLLKIPSQFLFSCYTIYKGKIKFYDKHMICIYHLFI